MTVRIEYVEGNRPSTPEILNLLNKKYPDKVFTAGLADTIVESYREDTRTGLRNREILLQDEEDMRQLREAKLGFAVTQASQS